MNNTDTGVTTASQNGQSTNTVGEKESRPPRGSSGKGMPRKPSSAAAIGGPFLNLLFLACVALLFGCKTVDPKFSTPEGQSLGGVEALTPVELTNRIDPAWLQPTTNLFTLGPGDRLEIELLGDPLTRVPTAVGPDGRVYFNLLPGIDVWGLTLAEAKHRLESEFTRYVREQPVVSLTLRGVESQRIWILGRVQAPGVYGLPGPMTLLEAVAMAGGTLSMASYADQEAAGIGEELADLQRSFVLRGGKLLPVDMERLLKHGDLTQNIYLEPDDFVYFPAATTRDVYVLGAVSQPRAVPYKRGLTVAAAIASAYGTLNGAYLSHVAVVRGSLTKPQIAVVDYRRVIRGEAKDIELQPKDIVYVPLSPYRYLVRYAELIVNTFVSSAAINAGTRATSDGQTGGAGVFIPVGSSYQVIPPVAPPPVR